MPDIRWAAYWTEEGRGEGPVTSTCGEGRLFLIPRATSK